MAVETAPAALPADEQAARARLANVATYGSAGHNLPAEAAPPAADPRQAAIDAALGRGQQINATAPVQDAVAGQIGQVYDTGNAGLGAIRGATGGVVGGMANAAGEYERQLALAAPIEEGRNKVAIQQILADRSRSQQDTAFRDRQFAQSQKEFDQHVKEWEATQGKGAVKPISPLDAAPQAGLMKDVAAQMISTPEYAGATDYIQSLAAKGLGYDEMVGALQLLSKGPLTDADGAVIPQIPPDMVRLLTVEYGQSFMTPDERASYAARKPLPASGPQKAALNAAVGVPSPGVPQGTPASRTALRAQINVPSPSPGVVKSKVAALKPHQKAILQQLASAHGMSVEDFLARNPDLLK